MSNTGIALQLYTVRDAAAADFPGTLEGVRAAGFDYAEWAAMPALPHEVIARELQRSGLKVIAAHTTLEALEQDYDAQRALCEALGCPDLVVGRMPPALCDTPKGWAEGIARLSRAAERLHAAGIRLSYHNHAFELARFPGGTGTKLETLFAESAPALHAELDTAWLHLGGADIAAKLRALAGRCPLLHVKDCTAATRSDGSPEFVPLGEGILDWPAIFDAAEEAAVEWYLYEQDTHEGDVFEALRTSYEFLAENA